jgi:hypothetical protein
MATIIQRTYPRSDVKAKDVTTLPSFPDTNYKVKVYQRNKDNKFINIKLKRQ